MKRSSSTKLLVVLGALAAAAFAAGAGRAGESSRPAAAAVVHLRMTSLGSILVDARGRTLYLFEKDTNGASSCNSACASYWPPLMSHGAPHAAPGVRTSLLGITRGRGGSAQVTYAGHPLYTFVGDKRAGQTTGQGLVKFGAGWYVVAANGKKIEPASSASNDPGSGSGDGTQTGGGYGYSANDSGSGS